MKKIFGAALMIAFLSFPLVARAEEVSCSSQVNGYGSGAVCGAYTTKDVNTEVVLAGTDLNTQELITIASISGMIGLISWFGYKLSYKWYIFG